MSFEGLAGLAAIQLDIQIYVLPFQRITYYSEKTSNDNFITYILFKLQNLLNRGNIKKNHFKLSFSLIIFPFY